MRLLTRDRLRLGLSTLVLLAVFLFAAVTVTEALVTGDYHRKGRVVATRDHPARMVLLALGGLVAGGAAVVSGLALLGARGEQARINAYLAGRTPDPR